MIQAFRNFDVTVVGDFTIDSIILPNRTTPFTVLGGSATYVSFAARRLDARVSVISKIGSDFPEAYKWWLKQEGLDLSAVKTEPLQTTRFELKYNSDLSERTLRSASSALPITVNDLPSSLKSKAIHFAPIGGEVEYAVAEKLASYAEILSLDPQGLVRKHDENGNITLGSTADKRILELVDIYKSSLEEIEALTGLSDVDSAIKAVHDYGVRIVIVTLGANGVAVSDEDAIHRIPTCKPEKVVDPTGAGDAFIGGFLAEYVNGESLPWCSCVGSASASFVVEAIGPTLFGDKTQVYQRARVLYEKEIKE
jgi:sugar/nucleoside kinase (ribokinase family)